MSRATRHQDEHGREFVTVTMPARDFYAISDGINLIRAGYPEAERIVPNAREFTAALTKLSGVLIGFEIED